jgi:serralysin
MLVDASPARQTPLANGIEASRSPCTDFDFEPSNGSNDRLASLVVGVKWGGVPGKGVSLTTSFSTLESEFAYTSVETRAVDTFNANQIDAAWLAMSAWAEVADLRFEALPDNADGAGDIRWSQSTNTSVYTAFAYFPSGAGAGGDIWFGPWYDDYKNPVPGGYGYHTFLHELGHALGLGHPHQGSVPALVEEDQLKYSVMSYRDYAGDALDGYETAYYPTTPMLNDILAIQWLYGANVHAQDGDNVYAWDVDKPVYETIWDTGGVDLIDASSQSRAVMINLNEGAWSEIGAPFWNGAALVRDCLAIAYGSRIENATGSEYDDRLFGNHLGNVLIGNGGDDWLDGMEGADTLIGGIGNDTYVVDSRRDTVVESDPTSVGGIDLVRSSSTYVLSTNVENLTLIGGNTINAVGNGGANRLVGNAGDNAIKGLAGDDTLIGGVGADTLQGGLGSDVLRGGQGSDVFVFDTAPGPGRAFDRLVDFNPDEDVLVMGNATYAELSDDGLTLSQSAFQSVSTLNPEIAEFTGLLYEPALGRLYFAQDADELESAMLIAIFLNHPALDCRDFFLGLP